MGQDTESPRPSLRRTLSFFLPLALTNAIMMISHSLISAGLARTVSPEASIAAYSVALAVAQIFEAPILQSRQMTLALAQGSHSYRVVFRLAAAALTISLGLEMLLAFSPLGSIVFAGLMHVPTNLVHLTVQNFWVVMLLPLVSGIRSFFQGALIKFRHTPFITLAMVFRLSSMAGLIYAFTRWGWVKGGYVGGIALIAGVGVEMVMAYYKGRQVVRREWTGAELAETKDLNAALSWRFYCPLAAAAILASMAKPYINAGLAQGQDATIALAAYSVAYSLGWIIVNPVLTLHQATIVLRSQRGGDRHVRRFALAYGALSSCLLLAIGLSPLGTVILAEWIGVSQALLAPTLVNLQMMAWLPIMFGWLEYTTGVLLLRKATKVISMAKVVNLLATVAAVTLLTQASGVLALTIGPLSQAVGSAAEGVVLTWGWWSSRDLDQPLVQQAHSAAV